MSTQTFEKIANFRDISLSLPSTLKPSLLYRSANPDLATPFDQSLLQNHYNLKTIVDLRTDSEHLARKRNTPADVPILNEDLITPAEPATPYANSTASKSGLTYRTIEINFNGPTYTSALFAQLSYWNQAKLALLYALGYRTQAIRIIGENVMAQRGLVGLAKDSLAHCRAEIKEVFDVLADESNYPLLIHCTQGKDRTGLVVLLVLGLLGADRAAIQKDYLLSREGLAGDWEERVRAIREIGLPEEFASVGEEWVGEVMEDVERLGGFEGFLVESCGVGKEQVQRVREILGVGGMS